MEELSAINNRQKRQKFAWTEKNLIWIVLGAMAAIFVVDLFVPLGVAIGVLYCVAMFPLIGIRKNSIVLGFALTAITLTSIALAVHVEPDTIWKAHVNRVISVFAIILTYTVLWFSKKVSSKIQAEHDSMVNELDDYAIYRIDEEGKILSWNTGAKNLLDYSRKEIIEKNFSRFFTIIDQNAQKPQQLLEDAKMNGRSELRGLSVKNDGTTFSSHIIIKARFDQFGNFQDFIKVMKDVTFEVEKEKALHKSITSLGLANEQQVAALDEAAIVSITDAEGNILSVNQKFCEISGYPEEELIGQNHRILKSGIQTDSIFVGMWAAIKMGKVWRGEICNKAKDGSYYWVYTTICPFKNTAGEIEKFVSIRFDISKIKEQASIIKDQVEELQQQNENLNTLNRDLEVFSYSVSHDLKAPLRTIQGFSQNLSRVYHDQLDDKGKRWLEFIQSNAERMDSLIRNILDFSALGRKKAVFKEIDMNHLVQEVIDHQTKTLNSEINEKIKFDITDLPDLTGDYSLVYAIWNNLVGNAIKYSNGQDLIKIEIDGNFNSEEYTYSIKDNGVGFDMKYADDLFTAFKRLHADDEFEGNGIGLASVKKAVDRHNGTIRAESKIGQGSLFEIKIPKLEA